LKRKEDEMTSMDRRRFVKVGVAASLAAALPGIARAEGFSPQPGAWRTFRMRTLIEIAKPEGKVQAWVPLPSVNEAEWSRVIANEWNTTAKASLERDAKYGAEMLHVEWSEGDPNPVVEIISRVAARDRSVDLGRPGAAAPLSEADRKLYTGATALVPTDGIVKQTSDNITARAKTDVEKARAIYEWIVDNTFRDPKTRGCGIGDVASMLKTNNLGGKCADLNALFVGLARAAGLPARDVYGIRVAPSKFGYRSLGANSELITKAQHCRAEVYLAGYGWVPVDPADVRKVVLEEPPANLAMINPKVVSARRGLFGGWEGNWIAYNFAHDVKLPGSKGPVVDFLMYPQAETAAGRLDSLEPDAFKYTITANEVSA
jgi:transglutaminase-like putative cysteine protease